MKGGTHPKTKYIYVGVDSHKLTHTATIINCFNEKLGTITFKNNHKGFVSLIELASRVGDNTPVIYGLEDTKQYGYLLKNFLMQKGLIVKHINSYSLTEKGNYELLGGESPDIALWFLDAEGNVKHILWINGGGLIRIIDPTSYREFERYWIRNGSNAVWEFWEKFK